MNTYNDELDAMRPLVAARSRGRCEGRVPGVCTGRAEHVHHVKLRGQGGGNELGNLRHLCNACHRWVHANIKKARARGLLPPSAKDELDQMLRELREAS